MNGRDRAIENLLPLVGSRLNEDEAVALIEQALAPLLQEVDEAKSILYRVQYINVPAWFHLGEAARVYLNKWYA